MNYLAHLYFSDANGPAWAGSLMGDFVKGRDLSHLPVELARHLRLHRFIDHYTTINEDFHASSKRMRAHFRYARGILIDVFYDHFLARQWRRYHEQTLADFSAQVYQGLFDCYDDLSPGLQQQLPHMAEHDWLSSYQHPDSIERVLCSLERRLGGKFPLAQGMLDLELCRAALEDDFKKFMAATIQRVDRWKREH